jgi:DnaJ-class molecular chaperone
MSDSQPFSASQTVIPTPYTSEGQNARQAPQEPPQHLQDRMFRFPDAMRGQLAMPQAEKSRPCPYCNGYGTIWVAWHPTPVQCGHCHGTGVAPEADHGA